MKNWIKDHPIIALIPPMSLGVLNFVGNLLVAISDGDIDGAEAHNLMSGASGIESILLIGVMIALKSKGKK